ncbi:MAG: right-handed parallel beta-helix repeat-containing protein [Ruminococcaceae bacterium]|nr:right-handed parallel beta-helix repeat-containing protein [Oscillospiraceae bacterium]
MKSSTKLLATFLALVSVLTAASCGGNSGDDKGASGETVKIVDNGKTEYKIIRSDTSDVGGSAAAKMRSIMETVTDDKVELSNDFEHEKLGTMRIDTEILVGPTNRDESSMHEREFTYLDYAIDMDTTRLSLTGGSSQALVMAAEYIGENFVDEKTKTIAIPKGTVYEYYHDYPLDKFTIGGRNIEEFVFVASPDDQRPRQLANNFLTLYGKTFRVEAPGYEDPTDCEIILSSADGGYGAFSELEDFAYMYKVEGTTVYIGAKDIANDADAWDMFVSDILGDIADLKGTIEITDCERTEFYPHAEKIEYTEEFAKEVDAKAEALKTEILNTPNMEIPDDAIVYYVSPDGDDSNDGKSPENSWKTLSPVNNIDFPEGTYILFERGGIWRGQIKAKTGVTYSAYGEGPKPALYGGHEDGADPSKWTLMEGTDNIWIYADEMIDSGTLIFNHGEQHAYKEIPSYIDGGFKKRKAPEEEFDIIEALDVDLDFFQAADSLLVDGKYPRSGDAQGEIYLRCDAGNPGEVFESIEFVPRRNGFAVGGDNVTIDNFTVKYIGAHGVGAGTRAGLTVQNCEFGWIGGGIQSYAANGNTTQSATRFGNAIEIYGGCEDFDVHNNYIWQVYDAGITHQYKSESFVKQSNVSYYNNLVENCVYSIEYFLNSSDNPEQSMYNIKMYDNILRFAGCGWGNQRPDKGSQAHIKGWDHDNPAVDFEIYNNIMDRSANWMIHCGYKEKEWEPKIYGNTFIQYHDGMFGRYDVLPTKVIPYDNAMLSDERLFDNTFYFITDDGVPSFVGDRGTLSLKDKYNNSGMIAYGNDDYIELHGEKITDKAEIEAINETFGKAFEIYKIRSEGPGTGGKNVVISGEDEPHEAATEVVIYKTMAEFRDALSTAFDEELVERIADETLADGESKQFFEIDGVLYEHDMYRMHAPFAIQYAPTEYYLANDGTVQIVVNCTETEKDIEFGTETTYTFKTVYTCKKVEDGSYRMTGRFIHPGELFYTYKFHSDEVTRW